MQMAHGSIWLGFNVVALSLTRESDDGATDKAQGSLRDLIPSLVLFFLPFLPRHRSCLFPSLRLIPQIKKERSPAPISGHYVYRHKSWSRSRRERTHRSQSSRRYAQCYPLPLPDLTSSEPQLCVHSSLSHVPRPTFPHTTPFFSYSAHPRALCSFFIHFPNPDQPDPPIRGPYDDG